MFDCEAVGIEGVMGSKASLLLALSAIACALAVSPTHALPPGRSWAPTTELTHPRIQHFRAERLEVDSLGIPLLIVGAQWDTVPGFNEREWAVFGWNRSDWRPLLFTGIKATFFPEPVLSFRPGQYLVWISTPGYPTGGAPLLFARILPSVAGPETVMVTTTQSSEYGAALSSSRRWVVRSQQRGGGLWKIRTAYSDTIGIWRELPEVGIDEDMCTVAPLDDRRAMVVYTGFQSGLVWAIVDGEQWTESGTLDPRIARPLHPRFRFRPSGGLWLIWTDGEWVRVSSYRDDVWSRGDSTRSVHPPGQTFISAWNDMSRDPGERPVLVWGDLGYGYTYRNVGCIAFPNDSGWDAGEEIPGSDGMNLTPHVTRDRNGDAWVTWDAWGHYETKYTHTYVSATASAPVVSPRGRGRQVTWTLSEPAPESWWVVLRSRGGGDFEPVARVSAGSDREMSWRDESPQGGLLRYKIRRECVDARYEWETPETPWPTNAWKAHLQVNLSQQVVNLGQGGATLQLDLSGAKNGGLEVDLYDIQGRLVRREHHAASGTGQDTIHFSLSPGSRPLRPGMYFITVRELDSDRGGTARFLLLK